MVTAVILVAGPRVQTNTELGAPAPDLGTAVLGGEDGALRVLWKLLRHRARELNSPCRKLALWD